MEAGASAGSGNREIAPGLRATSWELVSDLFNNTTTQDRTDAAERTSTAMYTDQCQEGTRDIPSHGYTEVEGKSQLRLTKPCTRVARELGGKLDGKAVRAPNNARVEICPYTYRERMLLCRSARFCQEPLYMVQRTEVQFAIVQVLWPTILWLGQQCPVVIVLCTKDSSNRRKFPPKSVCLIKFTGHLMNMLCKVVQHLAGTIGVELSQSLFTIDALVS